VQLSDADKAAFVAAYPGMRLVPKASTAARIYEGTFHFHGAARGYPDVEDRFHLRIVILEDSFSIPKVQEIGGRIKREPDQHVNGDGTLCLGTDLRIRTKLGTEPTLMRFVERCLIPYLAGTRWREDGLGSYINGELPHYGAGVIEDYQEILGVRGAQAIQRGLILASLRRRVANKRSCPCGCDERLGRCELRFRLNALRYQVPRSALAGIAKDLSQMRPV
jgi:hypothetical protein